MSQNQRISTFLSTLFESEVPVAQQAIVLAGENSITPSKNSNCDCTNGKCSNDGSIACSHTNTIECTNTMRCMGSNKLTCLNNGNFNQDIASCGGGEL